MSRIRRGPSPWVWVALVGWFFVVFGFATLMDEDRVRFSGWRYLAFLVIFVVIPIGSLVFCRWRSERSARLRFIDGLPRPDQPDLPR
ncbi:hypothetical protein [Allobranchiibius huperziae]|uniref:Uncharacterized protein n=1 Tax=Allobranchiibius huperziae TaxID=1874116 RepID=A0A853DG53_9MICO|nr:hypothetical protein [Allobranchiibius huperziae]NYJ75768.1 hypothetical protein [Allobranchiibius huperziae]